MESGSQFGTYVAYFFVGLFLFVVVVAAARSYAMIMSLVLMAFMGRSKPAGDVSPADSDDTPVS